MAYYLANLASVMAVDQFSPPGVRCTAGGDVFVLEFEGCGRILHTDTAFEQRYI